MSSRDTIREQSPATQKIDELDMNAQFTHLCER